MKRTRYNVAQLNITKAPIFTLLVVLLEEKVYTNI